MNGGGLSRFAGRAARRLFDLAINVPRGRGRPIARPAWDRAYAAGKWDSLGNVSEIGHYVLIVGYAARLATRPRILDVGCGDGVLRGYFAIEFEEYVGLDISAVAVEKANGKGFRDTRFLVADFTAPPELGAFDIVVFNESIYYASDPLRIFDTYWRMLKPNGAVIVSMYDVGLRTAAMWRQLEKRCRSTHSTRLSNERGQRWDIRVFARTAAADGI